MDKESILVTGGVGFIGSHLVDRLILNGYRVVVVDNLSTGFEENLNKNAELCKMDIADVNSEFLSISSIKYIYHLAAQINLRTSLDNPVYDAKNNILGTISLADAAKKAGVKKFIFASTGGAIYSEKEPMPWTEKTPVDPQSPYGLSKLCSEKYLELLYRNMSVILRFSNVYGPRQNPHGEAGVVSIFINNMLNDSPLRIFGDGTQVRDYIYVDDVVNALITALNLSGTYNVSTGIGTDLNTLTLMILASGGIKSMVKYEPAKLGEMKTSVLSSDLLQSVGFGSNTSKIDWSMLLSKENILTGGLINKKYDWKPEVYLSDGIKRTVEWFKGRK